jgi:predicted protein tyrosine phosphatase
MTTLTKEDIGEIKVASRDFARQYYKEFGAVITIGDPGYPQFVVPEVSGVKQLILEFDDAISFRGSSKLVSFEHLERAIEFARQHRDVPLLVHCGAGERRSPATALAILADRLGEGREDDAIAYMFETYKNIEPNTRVIEIADHVLDRSGNLAYAYYLFIDKRNEQKEAELQKLRSKPSLVKSKKRWR